MESLPYEIHETGAAFRRSLDRRAAALGVTGAQWKVLFRLSRMPGLRQVELADMLDVEPITCSRIIDRLGDAGLVQRVADPSDRRAWRLHLTDKAQPLVVKLRAIADQLIAEAFADLTPAEIESTQATLAKIRGNLCAASAAKKAVNQ